MRKALRGSLSKPGDRLVLVNRLSDIAFAESTLQADTVRHQVGGILMKTSNLVALIVALIVSSAEFEAINLLFTYAATHDRPAEALVWRA
jgi:hypothetical protein